MNKLIIGLLAISSILMSTQAFARGNAAIYNCNKGEAILTQFRSRITLTSVSLGSCEGHVDIIGSSATSFKVSGSLGSANCNKAMSIEWNDENGLGDSQKRAIKLTSNSGTEILDCDLIQNSKD